MNRMPTLADLGNKSLNGLTQMQTVLILRELAYYRYLSPHQEYLDHRLEVFNRIEEMMILPNEYVDRQVKMDRFYKLIEGTFKKYEERKRKFVFKRKNLKTGNTLS